MPAVDSMDFLPVDSVRNRRLAQRGLSTDADSPLCEAASLIAVAILGFVVALVVQMLRWSISMLEGFKTQLTHKWTNDCSICVQCLAYSGSGALFVLIAFLTTERVQHVKGSGLVTAPIPCGLTDTRSRNMVALSRSYVTLACVAASAYRLSQRLQAAPIHVRPSARGQVCSDYLRMCQWSLLWTRGTDHPHGCM